eukprot:5940633-Amphidinium_carterae.1
MEATKHVDDVPFFQSIRCQETLPEMGWAIAACQVLSCTAGFDVAVQLLMDKVHHRDAITPQHCALILMGLRCGDVRDSVHCVLRSEAARSAWQTSNVRLPIHLAWICIISSPLTIPTVS